MGAPEAEPGESPLWLSHHRCGDYDRCVRWNRFHICRRCLVLYPLSFAVWLFYLGGFTIPERAETWVLWLCAVPVTVEWVGEHLLGWSYSPRRQTVFTAAASLSLGVGLGIHSQDPFALQAVLPLATVTVICAAAAVLGAVSMRHAEGADRVWEEAFEASEQRRAERLQAMLDLDEPHDPEPAGSPAARG